MSAGKGPEPRKPYQIFGASPFLVYGTCTMSTLRSSLNDLAVSFTTAVLAAIRSANLDDLLAETRTNRPAAPTPARRAASSSGNGKAASAPAKAAPAAARSAGRLRRRSPEEISGILDSIVGLLKKNRTGLRAEQIRAELGLQAKEMPRVLKEGLATQKLKSKGQKRATTYFAG
jgi:hypothetical protein